MKTNDLLRVLELTKPCISNHALVPMLSHFCFDTDTVTTFNGTQATVALFDSGLQCGIPGEVFYKLVSSYSTIEDLLIEPKDKEIHVKVGENIAKLPIISKEDFIFDLPNTDGLPSFPLTQDFILGLGKCLMSVSDNPATKNIYGVTLINSKKEAGIYATDLKTLSKFVLPSLHSEPFKLLLPKLFTSLLTLIGKENEGEVYLGDDFVLVYFSDILLYTKVQTEIDFLDYEAAIKKYVTGDLVLQTRTEEFLPCLNRALIFLSDEIDQFVSVMVNKKKLTLFTQSPHGNLKEDVGLEKSLPTMNFRIDAKLLENGLLATKTFTFNQTEGTVFIGKDESFLHLIVAPTEV